MHPFRFRAPSLRRTAVALALTVLASGSAVSATTASDASGRPSAGPTKRAWFTSWAQSQQDLAPTPLRDQSVRMITHLSQGGGALRVRIQNTFGTAPLTVDAATVGRSSRDNRNGSDSDSDSDSSNGGSAAIDGAVRAVTFDGRREVVVPPGGEVWSDAAALRTRAQDDVAVSLSVSGTVTPGRHTNAFRTNYLTPPGSGDHTAEASGSAYTQKVDSTYLVSAVDVHNPALKGTIVAFGSSVVDGTGSTDCGAGCTPDGTDQRWTDQVARRITAELPRTRQLAVANAGIAGTTSSAACPRNPAGIRGLDAAARLDRDVLDLHGVTGVLYYYGTNDLANGCDAAQILRSYDEVFQRLRAAGVEVYVTPITSRPGYSDQNNLDRHAVGTHVKKRNTCDGTCDGVMDFDQVLKDPLKPNGINPAYDTGDGVHANIAGQQALADFLSLPMLLSSTSSASSISSASSTEQR